ncbi:MAG TPA: hypothetical protein VFS43_41745 [Polyangiaceae bacterium]|nr:hypothetical protein [Polyangiaceae bacterium]
MNDLERVAVVIALVGAFRTRNAAGHLYAPFLEGNLVTLVAALVGAALCAVGSPSPPWYALARGLVLGTVAAGVMTALTYAGDHVGTALGRTLAAARPRPWDARADAADAATREGRPRP